MVCEGLNYCKCGNSKIDGCNYVFEYIEHDELPDNYKKSANMIQKIYCWRKNAATTKTEEMVSKTYNYLPKMW